VWLLQSAARHSHRDRVGNTLLSPELTRFARPLVADDLAAAKRAAATQRR
jgi:hypothetical protein